MSIKVHVLNFGRRCLYMRYRDPLTGKPVTRSTGTSSQREAERIAAKWEAELEAGRYQAPSKVTWEEFRQRFESEKLSGLSPGYRKVMHAAMNRLEALGGLTRLSQVNADVLSRFQASLRKEGSSETTIRSYLKHLRASLAWAEELGLIPQVPKCALPKGGTTSKMKGRPITPEEFARMLAATHQMNRLHDPAHWRRCLTALWLSGLRLAESLRLSWTEGEPFAVDLTGRHPLFRIKAGAQKSRRNELLLPCSPPRRATAGSGYERVCRRRTRAADLAWRRPDFGSGENDLYVCRAARRLLHEIFGHVGIDPALDSLRTGRAASNIRRPRVPDTRQFAPMFLASRTLSRSGPVMIAGILHKPRAIVISQGLMSKQKLLESRL